jgi:acyl-CoA-binding protein
MTLIQTFEKAVADSKLLTSRPDNDTLLRLYSFYKQATEGDAPDEGPSNPFDFIAKAKHNAWLKLEGMSSDDAMNGYVALVEQLKSK